MGRLNAWYQWMPEILGRVRQWVLSNSQRGASAGLEAGAQHEPKGGAGPATIILDADDVELLVADVGAVEQGAMQGIAESARADEAEGPESFAFSVDAEELLEASPDELRRLQAAVVRTAAARRSERQAAAKVLPEALELKDAGDVDEDEPETTLFHRSVLFARIAEMASDAPPRETHGQDDEESATSMDVESGQSSGATKLGGGASSTSKAADKAAEPQRYSGLPEKQSGLFGFTPSSQRWSFEGHSPLDPAERAVPGLRVGLWAAAALFVASVVALTYAMWLK